MPDRDVKTIRDLIYYQYAKIIMKKQFYLLFFILAVFLSSCDSKKKPEVELTRDILLKLDADASEVKKCTFFTSVSKTYPDRGTLGYYYTFDITNPAKIEIIIKCICDANRVEPDMALKRTRGGMPYLFTIVFETKKVNYFTGICWNDNCVYGLWWESPELLEIFKQWKLLEEIVKADPDTLPFPHDWFIKHPPKGMDTNSFSKKFSPMKEIKDSLPKDPNM